MDSIQLLTLCTELTSVANSLQTILATSTDISSQNGQSASTLVKPMSDMKTFIQAVHRQVCSISSRLQGLIKDPTHFVHHLATQVSAFPTEHVLHGLNTIFRIKC